MNFMGILLNKKPGERHRGVPLPLLYLPLCWEGVNQE